MEVIHIDQLKQLDDTQTQVVRRHKTPGVNMPDWEFYWYHKITEYVNEVKQALGNPQPQIQFQPQEIPDRQDIF